MQRTMVRLNPRLLSLPQRLFSVEHEFKSDAQMRKALVRASFIHAKKVGFNDRAIEEACKDFGLSTVSV